MNESVCFVDALMTADTQDQTTFCESFIKAALTVCCHVFKVSEEALFPLIVEKTHLLHKYLLLLMYLIFWPIF